MGRHVSKALPRFVGLLGAALLAFACNAVLGLDELPRAAGGAQGTDSGIGGSWTSVGGMQGSVGGDAGAGNDEASSTTGGGAVNASRDDGDSSTESSAGGTGTMTGSVGNAGGAATGTGTGGGAERGTGGGGNGGGGGELVDGEMTGPGQGGAGAGAGGAPDCEEGSTRPCSDALGTCARGVESCSRGHWGGCSVLPADADTCAAGNDDDCDGTPNEGCECNDMQTQPCDGPNEGVCSPGTSTCLNGVWSECANVVAPGERDCASSADNDCDGEPDNTLDDECPCEAVGGSACVEDAPEGWAGPAALATSSISGPAPSCAATGYDRQVLARFGELDEGEAACGCACSAPADMSCGDEIEIYFGTGSLFCVQPESVNAVPDYIVTAGQCTDIISTASGRYKAYRPTFTSGPCTAEPTTEIDTAGFTRQMVACETNLGVPDGCPAGAQCVPELLAPLEAWCIYREGAHECPGGPYSQRAVYYESFDDTRVCTTCSCGDVDGECNGSVHFTYGEKFPDSCAFDTLGGLVALGGCDEVNYKLGMVATSSAITPTASCEPSGGGLNGSVVTSGAVTVCCKL